MENKIEKAGPVELANIRANGWKLRAETAERRLAVATEALDALSDYPDGAGRVARAALAEITGEK